MHTCRHTQTHTDTRTDTPHTASTVTPHTPRPFSRQETTAHQNPDVQIPWKDGGLFPCTTAVAPVTAVSTTDALSAQAMSEEAATLGAAKAVTSQGNDFHSFIRCVCGGLFTCMSRDASLNVECVLNSYLNPRPQSHSLTHSGLLLFSLPARATIHMCTPASRLSNCGSKSSTTAVPAAARAPAPASPPRWLRTYRNLLQVRDPHTRMCSRVCRANVRAPYVPLLLHCVTLVHAIVGQGLPLPRKAPPRLLPCARRHRQRVQGCRERRRKGCRRCRWSSSRTLAPPHRRRKRRLFACVCVCVWRCGGVSLSVFVLRMSYA